MMLKRWTAILIMTVAVCAGVELRAQTAEELLSRADSIVDVAKNESDKEIAASLFNQAAYRYLSAEEYEKAITYAEKSLINARQCDRKDIIYDDNLLLARTNAKIDEAELALYYYIAANSALDKKTMEGTIAAADIDTEMGLLYFGRQHYAKAGEFFTKAYDTYKEEGVSDKVKQTTWHLAICSYVTGEYAKSAKYFEDILRFNEEDGDINAQKQTLKRLADIYQKLGQYDKALSINKKLYDICATDGDTPAALNALNNIAYCQTRGGNPNEAIKIFKQLNSLDIFENATDDQIAGTYSNIGLCYQNMGNAKEAYEYLEKAAELRKNNNQTAEYSQITNILALLCLKKRDLHNADIWCKEALTAAESTGDAQLRGDAYQTYNQLLQASGDYDKALEVYQNYLSLRDSAQVQKMMSDREINEDLRKMEDAEKDFSEQMVDAEISELTNRQLQLLADTRQKENELLAKDLEIKQMEQDRMQQTLLLTQQQAEAARREKAISDLKAQQAEDALKLQEQRNKELEDQRKINELESQKQKQILELQNEQKDKRIYKLIFALFGVILVVFIIIFIIVRKKNRILNEQKEEIINKNADLMHKNEEISIQKENLQMANDEIMNINNELSQQKEIIEAKNKSITDSIVYAQRIQQAVSSMPDFLADYNIEHFMFYRPKEIVSGDFYWFFHEDNTVIAVAADCTGHGVPGAFMSMLGMSLFNKIVNERRIFAPAQILNDMRSEVKRALHQDSIHAKNKDGMDLSLVKINTETLVMEFAGANNNGYLVSHYPKDEEDLARQEMARHEFVNETPDGFVRLHILPADKMPIGIHICEEKSFTVKTAQLRHGDSIYLTSDGFIDQFGGTDGRKFLTSNFSKMLSDICQLPMSEQCDKVIETHENWIADQYPQLDDIIVLGLKID